MILKLLNLLSLLIFITGCLNNSEKVQSSKIIIQSSLSSPQINGGAMVWGVGPSNSFMAISLADESETKESVTLIRAILGKCPQ
jgi:hypothetical protein